MAFSLATYALYALLAFLPMLVPTAEADTFLGRNQDPRSAPDPEFERHLLHEIEVILGSEHRAFTEKRLQRIENDLKPMFAAMPRTADGKLEHAATNYMLHRAFVQRHGWSVRSLSGEGKTISMWNSTSAASSLLENTASDRAIQAFEDRMGTGGTGLHEVAVLAATLEHLAHKEALERLRTAYSAFQLQPDDVISSEEADSVMQAYMALYLLGGYLTAMSNNTKISPFKVRHLLKKVHLVYPNWQPTMQFALDVKERVSPKRDYLYFADVANAVEEVGEHYGEFQDKECLIMRDYLLNAELPGSPGRVRLAEFYKIAKSAQNGLFSESQAYLRELGALDESDPANPRVLAANYVNGPSNCIASSNYYSVCCRDECENLLVHLESRLQRPYATPAELLSIVATLPSRTEVANRTLSLWLLARLDEVAAHHKGQIPLHSRLFAQWMHYAYPRECAYPHVAGAIVTQKIEDVLGAPSPKENIQNLVASAEQMEQEIQAASNITFIEDSDESMWTLDEELLVTRPEMPPSMAADQPGSMALQGLRGLALLAAAFSVSVGFVKSIGNGKLCAKSPYSMHDKYLV